MTALIPHPVLVSNGSDYEKGRHFSMDIDNSQLTIDGNIRVSARFVLTSRFIRLLITKKQAEFCAVIKCARTYQRRVYKTTDTELPLELPLADYADKIVVSPFIVSTKDIQPFKSEEHNEEFRGVSIRTPAGAILAIGAPHEFTVDSLQTLGAAIRLTTQNRLKDGEYMIDVEDDYINIQMNTDTYGMVKNMREMDRNILYPTLYLSALTHAIMNVDGATDRKWSQALQKTLDKHNINRDELKDAPYLSAQKLLGNPLKRILMREGQYD